VALSGGCGTPSAGSSEVQILTWWSAQGETQAMEKLRVLFNAKHPDHPLTDAKASGSDDARGALQDRMVAGIPPDTFLANGGSDLFHWVIYKGDDSQSKMIPLGLAEIADWKAHMPDIVLQTVTVSGSMYAVPLGVHRINNLFYNQQLFAEKNVPPPTESMTLDDMFALADQLQAAGVTPFATASGPMVSDAWPLALLLFENFLVARGGADYYRSFFCGGVSFPAAREAPQMVAAVNDLGRVLSLSYKGQVPYDWKGALGLIRDGAAAMTIMGDWAKGYFLNNPPPVTYVGEVPLPGTSDTFIFTTDTFGLPKGAHNPDGAADFLRLIGSVEGEDTFNPVKGSTPPRMDAVLSRYDETAQKTIGAYRTAATQKTGLVPATSALAPQEFMNAVTGALSDFANSTDDTRAGNASILLYTIQNYYDILKNNTAPGLCP
jgi:glucose/mannose transport system substrate-binding protein